MENQVNSQKIMLSNGLYLGLTTILISVIAYVTGATISGNVIVSTLISVIGFALMILFVILGQKQYKNANDGYLTLGSALKIGLGIVLIGGLISAIYQLIFVTYIDPEFMSKMMAIQQEKMIEANPNMTQEQLDMAMSMAKKFTGPWMTFAFAIIGSLFFGFIISLISGLVLKNEKPQTL